VARRNDGHGPISLDGLGDAFVRVACAILLDALAFIIWNVGTRPPLQLFADIRGSVRDARIVARGIATTLGGFIFVMAATIVLIPAIAQPARDLPLTESVTFVAALAVELLVGKDVRALASGRGRRS